MTHRLGIVTVTHNSGETLRAFLASVQEAVRASTAVGDVTVVVADNASPDASVERAIAVEFGADFVAREDNDGYGAGIDAAIRTLPPDADLVLISNPDVVIQPEALDVLVHSLDRLPDAAAVGPRILDPTGDTYPSARALPSLRTGLGHAAFGRIWPANPWSTSYKAEGQTDSEREAGWLSGACLMVRMSAYRRIGGFDHDYFMYFEDVDLGERLSRAGYTNVYVPDAVVMHTGAHSTVQSSRYMERVHHQSAERYLTRKYSAWYLGPLRLVLRLGLRARSRWVTRG